MASNERNASVDAWLRSLEAALSSKDAAAAAQLFQEDECFWRDMVTLTWNIVTLEGRQQIEDMLRSCLANTAAFGWRRTGDAEVDADTGVISAWLAFETDAATCVGHIRLKPTGGGGAAGWTMFTSAAALKGYPESVGRNRPKGVEHGAVPSGRRTWLEEREEEKRRLGYSKQPYVVIVGGGQAGIVLGARLRRLDVPAIVVEKNPNPGDSWRRRYKSLCLHDPVWYDHLPYMPFPNSWPVFCPKDKMGDWLQAYAAAMEICFWGSSEVVKATPCEGDGGWEVEVLRNGQERVLLRPRQLVLATGMSGFPKMPRIPGLADRFRGDVHHSSAHTDSARYAGKRAVVIGSNNSAHDIAADLWENGAAEVTMLQRSSSHVCRSDSMLRHLTGGLYSEEAVEAGISTDKADLIFASMPYKLLPAFYKPLQDAIRADDAGFYAALEGAGFLLDHGEDGTGLFMKYLRRGSGYYIDVGASQLIIDGAVRLRSGVSVAYAGEDTLRLSDGSEVGADVVVMATGYAGMGSWAAALVGESAAAAVGAVWGMGSATRRDPGPWEGELRNMWKPTRVPGLWFHGGNLHQVRHYSLLVALQLKARLERLRTPVYGIPPVHHPYIPVD